MFPGGGDDRSDITSGRGTHISDTASEAPSEGGSVMSSDSSSGFGSLTSGTLESRRMERKRCEDEKEISSTDQVENSEEETREELALFSFPYIPFL